MKRPSVLLLPILMTITALNIVLLIGYALIKNEIASDSRRGQIPLTAGIRLDNSRWEPANSSCLLIRITDDGCEFCKADGQEYKALLTSASRRGCDIVEVAPIAGQMAENPRAGIVQLKFIEADFGSAIEPVATPQTILLDEKRFIKWMRRGVMDDRSLAMGLGVLNSLSSVASGRGGVPRV